MKKKRFLHIMLIVSICLIGLFITTGCSACHGCGHFCGNVTAEGCEIGCDSCVKCIECTGCLQFCGGCLGN